MKILNVSGSLRERSLHTALLKAASQLAPADVQFEFANIANIPHYNEDLDGDKKPPAVTEFLQAVSTADALLFAAPEFNHSIPGVLKNAIDWASRPAFESPLRHKPVGIVTASPGNVGGARAQADLKNVLNSTLSLIYPSPEYLLSDAGRKFDATLVLTDADAKRYLKRYIEGLVAWAAADSRQ